MKHLEPNYVSMKVNGDKLQDKKTTTNAIKLGDKSRNKISL
jgi:hypothetical protein